MSLEFTLVRRAISLAVIDGPDAGDNPDILQAQGSVLFEPVIKKGDSIQVQTRGGAETYALAPIECPINDGIISHRGQDGVKLPAGGEAANPSLIRWKATFSRMQAGGKSFTLAPVIFDAVPGGEIDLTMVAPVAGAPEGVVRGPRGTSLESIIVDGSELVFTAVDDAGSFEIARIPLDEMVRAEADAAADGVRDALAVDVAASQSARDAAEVHANRAATSESNAKTSETNAKQSETNAGDYAAVSTTAATEAVAAMERATDLAGGDFATHEYVDSGLAPKADKSYVDTKVAAATPWRGRVPKDSDLDNFHGADKVGAWDINPFTHPVLNFPGAGTAYLWVEALASGYTKQRLWLAGIKPKELVRFRTSVTSATWTPWEETNGIVGRVGALETGLGNLSDTVENLEIPEPVTPTPGDPGLEHMMRVSDMRRRLGPVHIGDKGAVTIVFDHGTVNFKQWVLPLLQARGLRATLAMNAATVGTSTHELSDWTEIKSWSDSGVVEIANHGMTHQSASGYDAIRTEIMGGREAIETAIGKTVDTYVQVGMGDAAFDGFGIGRTVEAYATTHAGPIILQSHAVIMGSIPQPGAVYPIDGHIPQGFNGSSWIDSGTEATINGAKTIIDRAVTLKRRAVIRCHPQNMGEGKLTQAILADLLDHIKTHVDAGQLVMLPAREWAIAGK